MRYFCPRCAAARAAGDSSCPECATPLSGVEEQSALGVELEGKYFLTALIGRGSAGAVYRARQRSTGRDVAIKVLAPERLEDERAVARFSREVRAASQLSHPNTITLYDFGHASDGTLYIVMELVNGMTLSRLVSRQQPFSLDRATAIVAQVCDALAEAHEKGIVHRDLKCANIMVLPLHGNADFVKVLDFGLAKIFDARHEAPLTEHGNVVGTAAYMSPEQIEALPIDPRTDLYALGTVLFELLCGATPFGDTDVMRTMSRQLNDPVPALAAVNPGVQLPAAIDHFLARALAKDPRDRPASAVVFKEELLEIARQVREVAEQTEIDEASTAGLDEETEELSAPQPCPDGRTEPALAPVGAQDAESTTEIDYGPPASLVADVQSRPTAVEAAPMFSVSLVPRAGAQSRRSVGPSPTSGSAQVRPPLASDPARADHGVRRRRQLLVVAAALVAVAGGSLIWISRHGDSGRSGVAQSDGRASAAARDRGTDATEQAPGDPMRTRLIVNTSPPGASLYRRGERLCETPCDIEVERGVDREVLLLRLDGYQDEMRRTDLSAAEARVEGLLLRPRAQPPAAVKQRPRDRPATPPRARTRLLLLEEGATPQTAPAEDGVDNRLLQLDDEERE